MKRIRVTVTQEQIDKGEPKSPSFCPLARALYRTTRIPFEVSHEDARYWSRKDEDFRYFLCSPRAKQFIEAFDSGDPVSPSTFVLTEQTS